MAAVVQLHRALALTGACLCGAVRYEVEGPLGRLAHCHCSMCRKHHGTAFATHLSVPLSGFRWLAGERHITAYRSSPFGLRTFCSTCGSVVPLLDYELGLALCPAGNLDGNLDARLQAHVFVGSKAPWHSITDRLPQYPEF
jgi:hypothetical protein